MGDHPIQERTVLLTNTHGAPTHLRARSTAFRALESQLERSLAWRCSQTLADRPKGVRERRREAAAFPGGSSEKADFGAARLCAGLLEQCDLCADAVRALCTAVSQAAYC